MKIQIKHDVYDISNRIKDIDRDYFILFNTSTKKFEIHNTAQVGSTYCLTLPYPFLDERTLNFVNQTKSANIELILEKIENSNKVREGAIKRGTLNTLYESFSQI